jgi:RsiW-degrading membrane proteinase PrsW (M82 family)
MPLLLRTGLTLFSVAMGIVSAAGYVWLIWRLDRYEKEPVHWLAIAFFWGAVPAIAISAVVEIAFDTPIRSLSGGYSDLVSASFVAPPVEEFFKAIALWVVFTRARNEFDGVLDGIVYGAMIGFGFAMSENIVYFLGASALNDVGAWSTIVFGRTIAFGFNHAMFTSFTGIGLGLARYARSTRRRLALMGAGVLAAITAHLLHNLFLHIGDLCLLSFVADWLGVLGVLAIVMLAWSRERAWIRRELADEVQAGVLSPDLYGAVSSGWGRWQRALLGTGMPRRQARQWRRLFQAATELAFKKHQESVMAGLEDHSQRIVALRGHILQLRRELGDDQVAIGTICPSCGRPNGADAALCAHCGAGLTREEREGGAT